MNLIKIWQLIQGVNLADEHEIPVSEGQGLGNTKKYSIAQIKTYILTFVMVQIALITKGEKGDRGFTGDRGDKGDKGDRGDRGDAGSQGLKGDTGSQGPVGAQGAKGDKGDKGDTGAQGVQGIQGPQGLQGPQGEDGNDGADGAIIVAGEAANVLNGTVDPTTEGNDDDFYINTVSSKIFGPKAAGVWPLIGIQLTGPQGPAGAQGSAGVQGPAGNTGAQGPAGANGAQGPAGIQGPAGVQGPQGNTGPAGATGEKGEKGDQGVQGPAGAQGPQGVAGPKGDKGDAGEGVKAGGTTGQILAKLSDIDGDADWVDPTGGSGIPEVAADERVVTQRPDGTHVDYDTVEMYVNSSAFIGADFSTGIANRTGLRGQISYDSVYRYDCIGTDNWRRTVLNDSVIDLYLTDIDDSGGAKNSSDLNSAYPAALVGQQVWGTLYLYIKKTSILWVKIAITNA